MPNAYHNVLGPTPQSKPLNDSMVKNNAGGYVYKITPLQQFRRFLMLGTENGTYYVSEQKLTNENVENIRKIVLDHPDETLEILKEVSLEGLAARVSPTIFALAITCSVPDRADIKRKAFALLPVILRTNSHMLEFVSYVDKLRGWGRLLRTSISNWYNNKSVSDLDYQLTKYNNRFDWTTRDVLRMSKPVPPTKLHSELYGRIAESKIYADQDPITISDELKFYKNSKLAKLKASIGSKERYDFIRQTKLTREMVPTKWLTDPEVFKAFLDNGMPLTALLRSLGPMACYETFKDFKYVSKVIEILLNETALRQARIHPMAILIALNTYKAGVGFRGSLTWKPKTNLVNALDKAFYMSWKNVTPTNKHIMIALDVSGSMTYSNIMNTNLTCSEAAVAMSLISMATEPLVDCYGFSDTFIPLDISPRRRLDDNINTVKYLPYSATDCALPMLKALKMSRVYDAFIVYTDNETWFGEVHPSEALAEYRRKKNPRAKLVVVGMTATNCSIADPNDPGMLDVAGFDASAPAVISDFLR